MIVCAAALTIREQCYNVQEDTEWNCADNIQTISREIQLPGISYIKQPTVSCECLSCYTYRSRILAHIERAHIGCSLRPSSGAQIFLKNLVIFCWTHRSLRFLWKKCVIFNWRTRLSRKAMTTQFGTTIGDMPSRSSHGPRVTWRRSTEAVGQCRLMTLKVKWRICQSIPNNHCTTSLSSLIARILC